MRDACRHLPVRPSQLALPMHALHSTPHSAGSENLPVFRQIEQMTQVRRVDMSECPCKLTLGSGFRA